MSTARSEFPSHTPNSQINQAHDVATETIAIVGLGYVGLPLGLALGHHFSVMGVDIDSQKISAYQQQLDPAGELPRTAFHDTQIQFSADPKVLSEASFIIVAVPTPLDDTRRPDLRALRSATSTIGSHLQPGSIVVFESTVYPGLTEEVCIPLLEESSSLRCGRDFFVGYSPERINPGEVQRSLCEVTKIIAAADDKTLDRMEEVYGKVIQAGIYRAPSIKVAEAAKVLENTQRDLNIALMNELALIFESAGIDTHAVIDAASTKWNFNRYQPGLVGGHCIGVDPYYLTHLAEKLGYHPDVILAGRRVNDSMGRFVGRRTVKELIACGKNVAQSRVAILGLTFKEDVRDLRNSRVKEIVEELQDHQIEVCLCDPHADLAEVYENYGLPLTELHSLAHLDGIVAAVRHQEFRSLSANRLREFCRHSPTLIDVKAMYDSSEATLAGFRYWRL